LTTNEKLKFCQAKLRRLKDELVSVAMDLKHALKKIKLIRQDKIALRKEINQLKVKGEIKH